MVKRSLAILAAGIAAAFLALRTQGPLDRQGAGDAPYYSARAVAAGKGYVLHRSPWPAAPDVSRLPLRPAMLVPGALLFPHAPEYLVVRWTGILVHAIGAVHLSLLTWRVWSGTMAAYSGAAGRMALIGGLVLVWSRDPRVRIPGALICGASALSRGNLVILPLVFGFAAVWSSRSYWRQWRTMALWWGRLSRLTGPVDCPELCCVRSVPAAQRDGRRDLVRIE